jgi:hypothetical protein
MKLYFIRNQDLSFDIICKSNHNFDKNFWSKEINLEGELSKYYNKLIIINENKNNEPIIYKIKYKYDIELLKSNLQKCVRRNETCSALETVKILIQQNTQQLLRRLPIIALEDSIIDFDDFIFLIWIMIANSRGYNLNNDDIYRILLITKNICESSYRDYIDSESDTTFNFESINNQNSKDNIIKFYFSIFLRLEYGTMMGDSKWLKNLANKWLDRHIKNSKVIKKIKNNYDNLKNFNLNFNENLILKNYLLEAVDFHCHKNIFDEIRIKYKYDFYTNEHIKNTIWFLRSSINNERKFLSHNKQVDEFIKFYESQQLKYSNTYNKIKIILDEISKEYWIKSIKKVTNLLNYFDKT